MSKPQSTPQHVTLAPMAIAYLPRERRETIASAVGARLWCPLHDDATHHWLAAASSSSAVVSALQRYADGETGSFVVETSSQSECAGFEADFGAELKILAAHYERVEVVFAAISYGD